jgi:K+-sensing histidine kinase KdpD
MSWHEAEPIPFECVATLVRQMTHDLRNGLNAIDLQAAYLAEIAPEGEVHDELKRVREMVREMTRSIQALCTHFQKPQLNLIDCPVSLLVESLRNKIEAQFSEDAGAIRWEGKADETMVVLDVERFAEALTAVMRNAVQFREPDTRLRVRVSAEDGHFSMELREKKKEPAIPPGDWGAKPFVSTRHGGYGLGLLRARVVMRAQGGELSQRYDSASGEVVSEITVPLSADAG